MFYQVVGDKKNIPKDKQQFKWIEIHKKKLDLKNSENKMDFGFFGWRRKWQTRKVPL